MNLNSVAVIIPCYNDGQFLQEAIESVYLSKAPGVSIELIIVNDGSTGAETLGELDRLSKAGFKIINKKNGGCASARNEGVKASESEFLVFLDSDNALKSTYIKRALEIFESDEEIGVVYGIPEFDGDDEGRKFNSVDFNKDLILSHNYIDACAIVRRQVWIDVGGFDESPKVLPCDDWDFWLRVSTTSWKFSFIKEKMFRYRIRKNSLMTLLDLSRKEIMLQHILNKQTLLLHSRYRYYFKLYHRANSNPLLFFLKIVWCKIFRRSGYFP